MGRWCAGREPEAGREHTLCRVVRPGRPLAQAIDVLLDQRQPGASICPSEVARAVSPRGWRAHLADIREVARHLARRGALAITQRWPSGRRRRFAKPLYGLNLYPGFESLPHRHLSCSDSLNLSSETLPVSNMSPNFCTDPRRFDRTVRLLQQPDRRVERRRREVHVALRHRQIRVARRAPESPAPAPPASPGANRTSAAGCACPSCDIPARRDARFIFACTNCRDSGAPSS